MSQKPELIFDPITFLLRVMKLFKKFPYMTNL